VIVEDFEKILDKVEKFGEMIIMPIGLVAVNQDNEGYILGIWKPDLS